MQRVDSDNKAIPFEWGLKPQLGAKPEMPGACLFVLDDLLSRWEWMFTLRENGVVWRWNDSGIRMVCCPEAGLRIGG